MSTSPTIKFLRYQIYRKKRLATEKLYTEDVRKRMLANELHLFALAIRDVKLDIDYQIEHSLKASRSKIFTSFTAKDYQNEVTRKSIIKSLIKINRELYSHSN